MLCEFDGTNPQLYNLEADRGEQINVAAEHTEITDRLKNAVLAWHQSMPPDNGEKHEEPGRRFGIYAAAYTSAIMLNFAIMFERLPLMYRDRADELIRRSLSALGEHVLTTELERSLLDLAQTMKAAGYEETAGQVRQARDTLAASIGKLASRATRVKGGE